MKKIAFIGAGYMGREHAKVFSMLSGVKLVGVCSRSLDRAEAFAREFQVPKVFQTIQALYAETSADLVIVSVPELEARDVILAASDLPWTILAEKPVGLNYREAVEISKSLKEKGHDVFVALNRRYYESVALTLRGLSLETGKRVILIQDQEGPARALANGVPSKVTENWMYANSIHLIDLFRVFGRGEISDVEKVVPYSSGRPGEVCAKIKFSTGDVGIYTALWDRPGPWMVAISTDDSYYELKPLESMSVKRKEARQFERPEISEIDSLYKPGLMVQAEEILKVLRGEGSAATRLDDALATMQLIHNIYGE